MMDDYFDYKRVFYVDEKINYPAKYMTSLAMLSSLRHCFPTARIVEVVEEICS